MDALQRCDPQAERVVAQHIDRLDEARRRTPEAARKSMDRYLFALRDAHRELRQGVCTSRTAEDLRRAHGEMMSCFHNLAQQTRRAQDLLALPASLTTLEHVVMDWLNGEASRETVTQELEQLRYRYQEAWSEVLEAEHLDFGSDMDTVVSDVERCWHGVTDALDQMQEAVDSGDEVALMPAWLALNASLVPLQQMQQRLFAA